MDQTAQNIGQMPQQQVRPMVEPVLRESVPPQPIPQTQPVPQVPGSMPQMISIGREQGSIQITTDDEDDRASAQQYMPAAQQASSEISRQPSPENIVTQAVPQEVPQTSVETIRPAVPEVVVPQELAPYMHQTPSLQNPMLPPELQSYGVKHTIPQVTVPQNEQGIKELPLMYEEAIAKEKAFQFKDSMKWLAAKVHYYWRRVNPEVYK